MMMGHYGAQFLKYEAGHHERFEKDDVWNVACKNCSPPYPVSCV